MTKPQKMIAKRMVTKLIGIREFRESIYSVWKEARAKNIRYVVMYHSKPIFEVNPIQEDEVILEELGSEVDRARNQVAQGEFYTQEELNRKLGL